jgi:TRAP-type C4-dicarboxylate transport system permease small subunit
MHWKIFDHLSWWVVFISSISLLLLVVFTGYQVWGRYVMNDTPTWTEKAALLLILIVALPMSAVGLREKFHLGIVFVVEALPLRVQKWVEIINAFILGVFGVAMIFGTWPLVIGTWGRAIPLIGIPQGVQYLPLIFTGILIVAFMAERIWFAIHSLTETVNKG